MLIDIQAIQDTNLLLDENGNLLLQEGEYGLEL